MHLLPRHWAYGLAAAATVHAGLIIAALVRPLVPEAKKTPPAGLGGVEVVLGLTASAIVTPAEPRSPADPAGAAQPPVPAGEPTRSAVPEAVLPVTPPVPPSAAAPEAVEKPASLPKPLARPVARRYAAEGQPRSPLERPAPPDFSSQAHAVEGSASAERWQQAGPTSPDMVLAAPSASEASGANATSSAGTSAQTGAPTGAATGRKTDSLAGPPGDYTAVLQAWLEKHKRYPRESWQRREQGTVLLRFVIDREGRVLSFALEEPSGHATLDREAVAMIKRAQPMPPMPETMSSATLELVVPVRYALR